MVVAVVVVVVVLVIIDELFVDSDDVGWPCVLNGRSLFNWLLATSLGVG